MKTKAVIDTGEDADVIGEKHIRSNQKSDFSPPTILMDRQASLLFNKSTPVKDLSFFEGDLRNNL